MEKAQRVVRAADKLFSQGIDWATFFRKVLGVNGVARQLFPHPRAFADFEQTPEYAEVQRMLAELHFRSRATAPTEPTKMITVRLPASVYAAVQAEAHDRRTSMNKLCVAKLLQMIDDSLVPTDLAAEAEEQHVG